MVNEYVECKLLAVCLNDSPCATIKWWFLYHAKKERDWLNVLFPSYGCENSTDTHLDGFWLND